MVNYQNGKIYTIRSRNSDKVYIGSTCNELRKRFHEHKRHFKMWVDGKRAYVSSYEVFKDGMCYIELLEKCPCNDKNELERREGQLIRSMECVNKHIAGRSIEEVKEYQKEWSKEWYEKNKEKVLQKQNEYYSIPEVKEKIKEKRKEYYQKIKEEYNKKQNEKINCYCGSIVSRRNKAIHMRSKKHKTWESEQEVS